ncbi:MAG: hypothetical protein AAF317_17025, partial [Pseudomonadota bacterium]
PFEKDVSVLVRIAPGRSGEEKVEHSNMLTSFVPLRPFLSALSVPLFCWGSTPFAIMDGSTKRFCSQEI